MSWYPWLVVDSFSSSETVPEAPPPTFRSSLLLSASLEMSLMSTPTPDPPEELRPGLLVKSWSTMGRFGRLRPNPVYSNIRSGH